MPAEQPKLYPIAKRSVVDQNKLTSFYRAANKIRGIPDLPGSVDELVEVVADFLARQCVERIHNSELWSAARQAEWLIDGAATTWKKWAGLAGLKELYDAEFFPSTPTFDTTTMRSGPITPNCSKCDDQFTMPTTKADVREWCDCEGAKRQRVEIPAWLELINTSAAKSRKLQRTRPRRSDNSIRELLG